MHLDDPETQEVDNFDDAFAQFSKPDAGAPGADSEDEEPGDDDDTAAGDNGDAAAGGDSDGGSGDADGDAADGGDPDATAGADGEGDDKPDPAPEDRADKLIDSLTALLGERETKTREEPQSGAGAADEPELYSAEEQEFLKTYDEDWGDVTRGEALKRRGEYQQLLQHVFAEVTKVLGPIYETVETLATRTHLQDIESSVPDYEDLRDGVISWVEEQPTYLQQGMKQVIQSGTAEEVADLIGRYREARGIKPKAAAPDPTKNAELPEPTKKAVEALAPVSTKRTAIPQQDDPDDFDSAFKRYAGKSG